MAEHAELEKYHYRAVRENPLYVLDGMMDVEREWQAMNTQDTGDLEARLELLTIKLRNVTLL